MITTRAPTRRDFVKRAGLGALTLAAPGILGAAQGSRRRKPNFLFILVDDLGWKDLGCYGSSLYDTPNIDRLAAQGMRFTSAYAASPVCSPTRASIMTGKHPARLGITDWIPGNRPKNRKLIGPPIHNELPLEEVTIAEALKGRGYATFFAGKWHLGSKGHHPEQQGFDINKGGHDKGSPPGGYYVPYENPTLADGREGEYLPDRLADESIRFLETRHDDPFLLFLSFYTVHTPIQACKKHVERYKEKVDRLPESNDPEYIAERDAWAKQRQDNAAYASMVHAMDENVGRVLAKLDKLGLADDTVVIFMSDNGGLSTLGWKGSPTSNLPLRAGKGWCYEGGIREPMIIRAPGATKPGSVCDTPVISMDFYPTMLELAGLAPIPVQHRDGLSLAPLLKGGDSIARDTLYWHYPHYHGSLWTPGAAVRHGDWKLIEFNEEGRTELYNLADDIAERTDLAAKMPGKRDELAAMLHAWQGRVGASLAKPNPDYKPKGE